MRKTNAQIQSLTIEDKVYEYQINKEIKEVFVYEEDRAFMNNLRFIL